MRARIVRCDGASEPLELPEGSARDGLEALYKAIGCTTVDVVRLVDAGSRRPGLDMWVDDDGLYTQPANWTATLLAGRLAGRDVRQTINGNVVLTGGADGHGRTLGLTEGQDRVLAEMAADARADAASLIAAEMAKAANAR